jgi:mono/diheme cytochrome c family protein
MRSDKYQILLILSGVLVTLLFGLFLYREVFPEYRIYQNDYVALEEFRSTYTHQPVPLFKPGIKQIVIEREDRGPALVDRCTSCHVALQIPYFSATKAARDLNGQLIRDEKGKPVEIPNEDYIWLKLDEKIAELRDEKVNEHLAQQGASSEVKSRLKQAADYEALKTAHVDDQVYDVTKALVMHPLMGNETRPFEYHPIEEYGCTSCHNGNGRGLVTDKAHGPVFDGNYEEEYMGPSPEFTEEDPENDPRFSKVFNHKPGHALLFQTQPIYVGKLIESKCLQCHQTSDMQLNQAAITTTDLAQEKQNQLKRLVKAYESEKQAVVDLLKLNQAINQNGYLETLQQLKKQQLNYILPATVLDHTVSQVNYLERLMQGTSDNEKGKSLSLNKINEDLIQLLGSQSLVDQAEATFKDNNQEKLFAFLKDNQSNPQATGSLFLKANSLDFIQNLALHAEETERSFTTAAADQQVISALLSEVDDLTSHYQRGKNLFVSQACYACHRIAGLSRGGVGPELTRIGTSYPWYIKESIVWPQADLRNSTMPNMRLDHVELEDLMTYLLAQQGDNQAVSQTAYQASLQAWDAGRKLPWEKPVSPAKMHDLNYAMTVFTTEGCASCHRLQGFESNVGFKIEKEPHTFEQLEAQKRWFKSLFPEVIPVSLYDQELPGSEIANQIEKNAKEIDERLISNARENSIIEQINREYPQAIEALYSNFRYVSRSKNHYFENLLKEAKTPEEVKQVKEEKQAWEARVHRVFMTYIQVYGLGRLIGPHLNWSGIYRTDEWLMEHFRNPQGHVPRSIMPALPFDDTKFYALTYMLNTLAVRNRAAVRQIWDSTGFDPVEAYQLFCSQCHGLGLQGNGVLSEWLYPIPKNLRNPDFLRYLTKEKVEYSLTHGVKGAPMPPWGEIAPDKSLDIQDLAHQIPVLTGPEIRYLTDWLFSFLPGGEVIRQSQDVPKWNYTPKDVLEELQKEGGHLIPLNPTKQQEPIEELPEIPLPKENNPPPADESVTSFLTLKEDYYVAIYPEVYPRSAPKGVQQVNQVEEIFDLVPYQTDTGSESYYIKKKFYTPYNIEEGRKYFLLNCAVCHGNEGDGSGSRGRAMQDAKPRMLTNLDWNRSRDDLRFLRSIKYGVPGTSMTPWGDYTSSLQRMQLVMFIRTLIQEKDRRAQLDQALYQTFDEALLVIENARIGLSQQLSTLNLQLLDLKAKQAEAERQATNNQEDVNEALAFYQQSLDISKQIGQVEEKDQFFLDLKSSLKAEKELYFNTGVVLLTKNLNDIVLKDFLKIIQLNAQQYQLVNSKLTFQLDPQLFDQLRALREQIVKAIELKIVTLEEEKQELMKQKSSEQLTEEINANQSQSEGLKKLSARLITDLEETIRLSEKQKALMEQMNPSGVIENKK